MPQIVEAHRAYSGESGGLDESLAQLRGVVDAAEQRVAEDEILLVLKDAPFLEPIELGRDTVGHRHRPARASGLGRPELTVAVAAADADQAGGPVDVAPTQSDTLHLKRRFLTPLIAAVAETLADAEAYGRSAWETLIGLADPIAGVPREPPPLVHASSELLIPAETAELDGLSALWARHFARECGLEEWEQGQTA